MKQVGRDATLDEASVRNADQRAADWRRPRQRQAGAPASPVTTIVVDPDVWTEALRIAEGNAARIQVHSATVVTVHNSPWRKRKGIPE